MTVLPNMFVDTFSLDDERTVLQSAMVDVVERAMKVLIIFGMVAYIVSSVRNVGYGAWGPFALQTLSAFVALTIFLFQKKLRPGTLVAVIATFLFVTGIGGLIFRGLTGMSLLALLMCVVVAGLILGAKKGWLLLAGVLVLMLTIGYLFLSGVLTYQPDVVDYITSPSAWINACMVFLFVGATLLAMISSVKRSLLDSLFMARSQERQYRLLAENMKDVLFCQDMALNITYVSSSVAHLFGYSVEEALQLSLPDIMTPESLERAHKAFSQYAAIARNVPVAIPLMEFEYIRKDGSTFWGELRVSFLRGPDRKPAGSMGVLRNITARKAAQEALLDSETKYRSVVETSNDGICIVDNGIVKFANARFGSIIGRRDGGLLGSKIERIIHPDDKSLLAARMKELWSQTRDRETFATALQGKDGNRIEVALTITRMNREGTVLFLVTDRSHEQRVEEELREAQRLESLAVLAGGIAHDFNNILTGIVGGVSLARSELDSESRTVSTLDDVMKASLRARDLTQQLLTFSKGGEPVRRLASLGGLLQDSGRFASRGSRCACTFTICKDLWAAEIDESQIGQVVQNLVINAVQALPGGGTITLAAQNVTIDKSFMLPLAFGKYVRVSVHDDGAGIPPEDIQRVFDPFFTTKKQGSGLGLATSYSIVKKHGGLLTVSSRPDKGTTFTMYLPASDFSHEDGEGQDEALIHGRGRILIMDDELIVRRAAERMFSAMGYSVGFAANGEDAIAAYRESMESGVPYDAVILDLTIPGGMGGLEAMDALLQMDPRIKAVVCSGYSQDPVMGNYEDYGFSACLRKPYMIEEASLVLRDLFQDTKLENRKRQGQRE